MYKINKITSHPTVDFAAEELKKYLRMMMPECGEIFIEYAPDATDGLRLGLMEDFGLDTSEAEDLFLDDILHIDTDGENGIIAGSNHRSVLLAVYRYLRENGCRWFFPGVDGEYIPMQDVKPTKYHKMADCRYRGQCNEGGEYQPNMMEIIDFQPKIGMNVFMMEFDNPKAYYDFYYNANHNHANRDAEPVTAVTTKQWKRQCEAELSKRSLQFHDMGHGWTAEPFGLDSSDGWVEGNQPNLESARQYLAQINGVRELWGGVALNTQFCMSNPEARTIVAKYVTEYAYKHQNADYLHVWLADGSHNHCECDECRKKTPSDWYVMLMNEIDERLTARELNTRVVFICYTDTTWAPLQETIKNTRRFSFLLAPITRVYTSAVPQVLPKIKLTPFELNKHGSFPKTVEEYILHGQAWKKAADIPTMVYEYHFWLHQYRDPGSMEFAKLIHDDVKGYYKHGFNGLIQDGSQRSFFPTGYHFLTYAETLFDTGADLEEIKRDYFTHAFGEIADDVIAYLTEITEAFDMKYLMDGVNAANNTSGSTPADSYYSPAHAKKFRTVKDIVAKYAPIFEAHKVMPYRAQTVSMKLIRYHMEYVTDLAEIWTLKALGADPEVVAKFRPMENKFGRHEFEIGTYFDQRMAYSSWNRILCSPKTFFEMD